MTRRFLSILVFAFATTLVMTVSASAQKVDCNNMTDDQIVLSAMTSMKVKYASQMEHINVRSLDRVVTIEGWATTKKVKGDIEKLVKKTACVKKVVNKLTIGVGGGCGPGTKACGTICIPIEETCNIGKGDKSETKP